MHVVVLGAGLAGLSTAYELSKAGVRCTVVERDDFAGGMACSWEKNGFWLDHGPHRFHSRDEELIQHIYEVLDNEVVIRDRMSRIYMQGKFFDYPLKAMNVLKSLPPHILVRAIWANSRFLNTGDSITGLLRQVSNSLIERCRDVLDLKAIMQGNIASSVQVLKQSLQPLKLSP